MRVAAVGIIGLAILQLTGIASAETVLRRGNGAEPGTLDPQKFDSVPEDKIRHDMFEGLLADGPAGQVEPGQAERWEVSPDGLVWTFHLRSGLKWSNGDPLTSADFLYSFRRQVTEAAVSITSRLTESIVNAPELIAGKEKDATKLGVEAPDPLTLRITLAQPNLAFATILAQLCPAHRPSVEAFGRDAFRPGHAVSNGAYRLVEWSPQSRVTLERNPYYWDAAHVAIDRVEFYPIENEEEELKRYRADGLDMTYGVPHEQSDRLKSELSAEYHVSPYAGTYYIGFNLTRPPFKDQPKLRRALSLAIDRETLVEKLVRGGGTPAYDWVQPGLPGFSYPMPVWKDWPADKRIATAKADYAASGYTPDKPLMVDLQYNTSENHKKLMIAVAGMWRQILGVQTRLSNMEFKAFIDARRMKQTTEAFRGGFIAFYDDAQPLLSNFRSGDINNDSGYSNPAYDAAFEAGRVALTKEEHDRHFAEAERILLDDDVIVPLYHYQTEHLIKPWVIGWLASSRDSFRTQDLTMTR